MVRAFGLIEQHCSITDLTSIYKNSLIESSKHNSSKVLATLCQLADFERVDILDAIAVSCKYGSYSTLSDLIPRYNHDISHESLHERVLSQVLRQGLCIAAFNGHVEVVRTLIEQGSDVTTEVSLDYGNGGTIKDMYLMGNTRGPEQIPLESALYGFAHHREQNSRRLNDSEIADRDTIISLLLERGADANKSSQGLEHLFNIALRHCSYNNIQLIMRQGGSLMSTYSQRISAFLSAASRDAGVATILQSLLQVTDYLDGSGNPKHPVANNSHLEPVLDRLLNFFIIDKKTARHDYEEDELFESDAIQKVLYHGHGAAVRTLLILLPQAKVEDGRYGLLLQLAACIGDKDWTKFLLGRGVDADSRGYYYGTALQCAARFGHLELVQLLLAFGANVNTLGGEHRTAIRAAVLGGYSGVLETLLQHGAHVNLPSSVRECFQPAILRLALEPPKLAILRILLAAGAEQYEERFDQPLALVTACSTGDISIVQLLLDNEVEVNPPEERLSGDKRFTWKSSGFERHCGDARASALHMACSKGFIDIVQVLLEHGADMNLEAHGVNVIENYSSKTPLQIAAHAGHLTAVQCLVKAGAVIDYCNSHGTALSIASNMSRLEVVQELLMLGATIAAPSGQWNALAEACRSGAHAVVEVLLDELPQGIEEFACREALSAAVSGEQDDIFQMLLARNVPVSQSILPQACSTCLRESSISALLEHGVDVDREDGEFDRALHLSAYHHQKSVVNILLHHGADANAESKKYGNPLQATLEGLINTTRQSPSELTPWHNRAEKLELGNRFYENHNFNAKDLVACEQIIRALFAYGANVHTAPGHSAPSLHLAAFVGYLPVIQQLLEQDVDLNSHSERFGTALFAALIREKEDAMRLLLSAGIDVNNALPEQGTALHVACIVQNLSIVRMLIEYGADTGSTQSPHGSPLTAAISRTYWGDEQDQAKGIVEIILRSGSYAHISEQDLLLAVNRIRRSNEYNFGRSSYDMDPARFSYGIDVVRLFFEHDQSLQATETVMLAAIKLLGAPNADLLRLLLERDGGRGVTTAMIETAKTVQVLEILLDHRPLCAITPEVVCNLCANCKTGDYKTGDYKTGDYKTGDYSLPPPTAQICELIRVLLEHEMNMLVGPNILLAVVSINPHDLWGQPPTPILELLEYLFRRDPELKVTEEILMATASTEVMKCLLKHAPGLKISPQTLSTVVGVQRIQDLYDDEGEEEGMIRAKDTWRLEDTHTMRGFEKLLLLFEHDKTATLPPFLTKAAPLLDKNLDTIAYYIHVLDRAPHIQLSLDILRPLVYGGGWREEQSTRGKAHLELFLRHGKTFEFDDNFREALEDEENELDKDVKALLYRLEDKASVVKPS